MLTQSINQKLNDQINVELYSAYIYLGMSTYASSISLNGCAKWLYLQAQEEVAHAMKIYNFVISREGHVELKDIKGPNQSFQSIQQLFQKAYDHERYVTSCINEISGLAMKESDYTTTTFLQWFLNEQIEEEANVKEIVDDLKLAEGGQGLFMIDRELGSRGKETEQEAK